MSEDASTDAAAAAAAASSSTGAVPAPAPAPTPASASVGLPADIVALVEGEQALADLRAALLAREAEVEKLRTHATAVTAERDTARKCKHSYCSTASLADSSLGNPPAALTA